VTLPNTADRNDVFNAYCGQEPAAVRIVLDSDAIIFTLIPDASWPKLELIR